MNTGGPAFPRKRSVHRADTITPRENDQGFIHDPPQDGMTLRDYFAGQALHGVLIRGSQYPPLELAEASYAIADAMLEVRAKQSPSASAGV